MSGGARHHEELFLQRCILGKKIREFGYWDFGLCLCSIFRELLLVQRRGGSPELHHVSKFARAVSHRRSDADTLSGNDFHAGAGIFFVRLN